MEDHKEYADWIDLAQDRDQWRALCRRHLAFQFFTLRKNESISWLAERLLAYREGLCSTEFFYFCVTLFKCFCTPQTKPNHWAIFTPRQTILYTFRHWNFQFALLYHMRVTLCFVRLQQEKLYIRCRVGGLWAWVKITSPMKWCYYISWCFGM